MSFRVRRLGRAALMNAGVTSYFVRILVCILYIGPLVFMRLTARFRHGLQQIQGRSAECIGFGHVLLQLCHGHPVQPVRAWPGVKRLPNQPHLVGHSAHHDQLGQTALQVPLMDAAQPPQLCVVPTVCLDFLAQCQELLTACNGDGKERAASDEARASAVPHRAFLDQSCGHKLGLMGADPARGDLPFLGDLGLLQIAARVIFAGLEFARSGCGNHDAECRKCGALDPQRSRNGIDQRNKAVALHAVWQGWE